MIARTTFQILLLVNLVLAGLWLAPRFGVDLLGGEGREPERLESQLHPAQVRLLGEATAPAAVSGPAADPQPAAPAISAPIANGPQTCVQWAGLTPEQVAAVNTAARDGGPGMSLREESQSTNSYWINIPPQGGKPGAEKRVAELRQQGMQDLFLVRDPGPDQWSISLGLYRNEAAANRFFEGLQKKGVKGARITVRENPSSSVRLSGPVDAVQRVAQVLAEALKNNEAGACAQN